MPGRMLGHFQVGPGQLGRREGTLGLRIGDARSHSLVAKFRELRELQSSSVADSLREFAAKITEKWEWLSRAPLLAHEQHRHLRQQEIAGSDGAHGLWRSNRPHPLSETAATDLTMV